MDPTALYTGCQISRLETHECQHDVLPQHTVAVLERQLHERNRRGWRRVCLNFTPSWFSTTMGTGIVSILLHNFPYSARWLYWLSVLLFCLNIALFGVCTVISLVRYIYFRGLFRAMLSHPVQSLFLGTVPMGFATIINMTVFVCVPVWGAWIVQVAWAMWWIDAVIAVIICVSLPFLLMAVHENELKSMTAAWILPIVSTIVAGATGGVVAEVLPDPQHALWTVVISYILWGMGFFLAMMVLVIYLQRLTMCSLPAREVIVSVFLPLGPIGQGSFAVMQLGKVAMKVLPLTSVLLPESGPIFYTCGFLFAITMWGFGLLWLCFAVASISRSRFPFNMGWWGFTFPLGVYSVATATIAKELDSQVFKILASIFSLVVVALWIVVSVGTIKGALDGKLLYAPCAAEYEKIFIAKRVGQVNKNLSGIVASP